MAHIHKHTHGALLSAGHVQEDGIPELRETVQTGEGVGVGVTVWKIQDGATALSDQGIGWRKYRHY